MRNKFFMRGYILGLLTVVTALLFFFTVSFCAAAELKIRMLDVGQGDAILIQSETQNTLIDTGDTAGRQKLLTALDGIKLDKIILTHPHADHIANVPALIELSPTVSIFDNGKVSTSPFYRAYVKLKKPETITKGDILDLGDGVTFEVIAPEDLSAKNINNTSIVGVLRHGNFSMLFTGDCEDEEKLEVGKCNVLKAGHHGSKTSAALNFLEKVQPEAVVISCGAGNKFGHPHLAALENFITVSTDPENIFCTAFQGEIQIITDGDNFTISTEKNNPNWLGLSVKVQAF